MDNNAGTEAVRLQCRLGTHRYLMKRIIFIFLVVCLFWGQALFVSSQGMMPAQGSFPGYFQPVLLQGPEGTQITLAFPSPQGPQFAPREVLPYALGLVVGQEYRMRLTNIPFYPGKEVFPTVQILARTFPPQGLEWEYPIPVRITQEDIELALAGKFVTRVIYLENPAQAMPIHGQAGGQISSDVGPMADILKTAAQFGQPVAILRIGGRVPSTQGVADPAFFTNLPPWRVLPLPKSLPTENATAQPAAITAARTAKQNALTINPALQDQAAEVLAVHEGSSPLMFAGRPAGSQEYLLDGGDKMKPVYIEKDWTVKNLEIEDTVAHFDTLDGKTVVAASNLVPIYAPRFVALRKIEGIFSSGQITVLSESVRQQGLHEQHRAEGTGLTAQEARAGSARLQRNPAGMDAKMTLASTDVTIGLHGTSNVESVMSEWNMLQAQKLDAAELVFLASGVTAAKSWMGSEGLQVQVGELMPVSVSTDQAAESVFVLKDDGKKVSKLRLIKVASSSSAKPGDLVEFTLRFDNVGTEIIGNVTVLDNLTTRLEFLPGTAQSSLESGFVVQPNEAGSFTLRFEITHPLQPGEFGLVKFQCRVR